jgi:hypothetical protein
MIRLAKIFYVNGDRESFHFKGDVKETDTAYMFFDVVQYERSHSSWDLYDSIRVSKLQVVSIKIGDKVFSDFEVNRDSILSEYVRVPDEVDYVGDIHI